MKRPWITGGALKTLLAIRGLQIGDEVRISSKVEYRHITDKNVPRCILTVDRIDAEDKTWPVLGWKNPAAMRGAWFHPDHVVAWRRPK